MRLAAVVFPPRMGKYCCSRDASRFSWSCVVGHDLRRSLFMYDNQLTGTLPSLSPLTRLTYLSLADNGFSGSLPGWIWNLIMLQ